MAKFFVGQRVRIKWSRSFKDIVGQQGRILECGAYPTTRGDFGDFVVAPDSWGSPFDPVNGFRFTPEADQLEPITPDGACPSLFSYDELMDRLRSGVVA